MEPKYVIKRKYLPTKLPTIGTLCVALALDHWNAPEWLWAVMGTLYAIVWIACIVTMCNEEDIDFEEPAITIKGKKFLEKLKEAMNKN